MYYAIISQDIENSLPLRKQARPNHIARLEALKDQGRLLIAGPHPIIDSEDPVTQDSQAGLVVAEFDSLADAEQWADDDPYIHAGVYEKVIVKPFKKVLP